MIIIGLIIPIGVIFLVVYGFYRRMKGKYFVNSGTSFVGRQIFMDFETAEKRQAMEEVIYQEEEERDEAYSPDDFDPDDLEDVDNRKADK